MKKPLYQKEGIRIEKKMTRRDIEMAKKNEPCDKSCDEPYFKTLKQEKKQGMLKKEQKAGNKQSRPTNKCIYKEN